MSWLDAVGWIGSALLIYSVMQARVLRFRVLNLGACVVLAFFNAALSIWPMVAMNIALCAINLWHIRALVRTRTDTTSYAVLEVGSQDEYLRHVLRVHAADILRFQPDLVWETEPGLNEVKGGDVVSADEPAGPQPAAAPDHLAFIVQREDETVGVVLLHRDGETVRVLLDYVTPRYRDFSPGQFVWRHSGVLAGRGLHRVLTSPTMVGAYYAKVGFTAVGDGTYELVL